MSDTNETLSAILAEMRLDADILVFPTLTPDKLRTYADRIEAAVERERAEREFAHKKVEEALSDEISIRDEKIKQSSPGNAAAMRDLLEKIRHEYGWGRIGCRTCVSSEADVERVSDLFEKQIDAALAAPARNCDRFQTADEARRAFESANSHGIVYNLYTATFDWLFAPAEGGDHA